jgi:uncharacterized membrane protein
MTKNVLGGFVAGTALMYLADPDRGRRRRAIARDKLVARCHDFGRQVDKARRDSWNRAQGINAFILSLRRGAPESEVLVYRVRSAIGRAVSHPHSIQVRVERSGVVILEGPVLRHERDYLLKRVMAVPDVRQVVDRLDVHNEAGDVPELQGGVSRKALAGSAQQSWTPALRVAAGALGGALFCLGLRNRGPARWAGKIGGAMLLSRVIANKPIGQIAGLGSGEAAAVVDKTIHINAPVEDVFAYWSNLENFPKFMTHLKDVRDLKNGRTHWVAAGPGGLSIPWDAEITEQRNNELLAWRSIPGSIVRTAGVVRFTRERDGRTRVQIHMSYCPPAGVLGHSVAWLLGADPKSEMDDDLVRLKSLLEVGKTRAHGQAITRDRVPVRAAESTQ